MTLIRLYRFRRSLGMGRLAALRHALASRLRDLQHRRDAARLLRTQLPFTTTRL